MTCTPTFVLGGQLNPAFLNDVQTGARPALEFIEFARRHDIRLLSEDQAPAPARWTGKLGSKIQHLKLPLARWVAAQAQSFSAIVTSGEDIGIPLALVLAARRDRTPLRIQVHGHYLEGRKFRLLALILRRMTSVQMLCLSSALQDVLVHTYGFSPERCHSVGFGVDTTFFSGTTPMPQDDVPLIVGAGMANRDYATLFEAVRGLPARVRIAADSPWAAGVPTTDLGTLPDNVEFRSAGTYAGLRDLYAEARCVVVPMHPAVHACGYAVMAEAMAMGRPVIASRLQTPCDFFEDAVHGAYVPPGDVGALRAAIQHLVGSPEVAVAQGQAARRRMEEDFTLAAFCDRIDQHLPK